MSSLIRPTLWLVLTSLVSCAPANLGPAPNAGKVGGPNRPYLDPSLPIEDRVDKLLRRLSIDDKIQLIHGDTTFTTPAIPELGIPMRAMSDGPHGVREETGPHGFNAAGNTDDFATALPVGIALASTWNPDLAREYGALLGREARARGKSILLGPGLNIQRTPLNGRNFEYFGEDPVLTSRMAVPWIQGIQSEHTAACAKHFALNNQELDRGTINVEVEERALREIYLPAFESAVKEAGVLSVMCSYNKFRGHHACHSDNLLNSILKEEWGFRGLVMSDWGATHDTREAALGGLDLEMGTRGSYDDYFLARPFRTLLDKRDIPISVLDDKVRRNLRVMFATKSFDTRPAGSINTAEHQLMARRIAEEAMVLLKNDTLLPLDASQLRSIAVIGENATRKHLHEGGSSMLKALYEVTPLEGIVARAGATVNVTHAQGYRSRGEAPALIEQAVIAAKQADVAIVVGGLNHESFFDSEGTDRKDLSLPGGQAELIRRVADANPRTVVVLVAGSPVNMLPWITRVPAVLQSWYGGMEAGHALAALLFGDTSPSGRLPCSFPKRLDDSPAHALGAYPGRDGTVRYEEGLLVGYRWFDAKGIEPLFPFGHGLSYTKFAYENLKLTQAPSHASGSVAASDSSRDATPQLAVQVDVTNMGLQTGAETVQVYVSDLKSSLPRPPKELKGFRKVVIPPGQKRTVEIPIGPEALAFYDPSAKEWIAEAGDFRILVGASSRDIRQEAVYHLPTTRRVRK